MAALAGRFAATGEGGADPDRRRWSLIAGVGLVLIRQRR